MLTLNTKIEHLANVGPSLKKTLNHLGLFYIEDLLYHLPFRYVDFSNKIPINNAVVGQMVTVQGRISEIKAKRSFRSRLTFAECIIEDETASLKLIWFNQPYIAKQLQEGDTIVVAGKIEWYKQKQITNPYFEQNSEIQTHGKILPIYHLTKGITNLRLAKLIKTAWGITQESVEDTISSPILKKFKLENIHDSLEKLHFPVNLSSLSTSKLRIAVEDTLPQQLASLMRKQILDSSPSPIIPQNIDLVKQFLSKLPFQLTASQKRASWDIIQDLDNGKPMNRLLEGDVGSGKTIVAILASLVSVKANYQVVLVAPTEILAKQHYETFRKFLQSEKINVGLFTSHFQLSQTKNVAREVLINQLSSGQIEILIATHAVFSANLHFGNLGLIIIDEQHRFGVGQRAFLAKQHSQKLMPHFLSMSATPIPRTLALSLFGNLEISTLKQLPSNRLPIVSKIFSEAERNSAYQLITKEIQSGRQAFIITPKVEESETGTKSVKAEFERLQKIFPKFKLGLIYGGLNGDEKEAVMSQFNAGGIDILVATTVIEIGIDIPNATVMLIEGAENFGLAQLHQLRGRVGRGQHQSYCFLFTTEESQMETERLKIFIQNLDGFKLAEYDLAQRGFGDLFGKNQSGFNFRYPEFITIKALETSRKIAEEILKNDPNLNIHKILQKEANKYLDQIHTE